MMPGLTYFYCNSVSQGEREAIGCGVERCRLISRPLLERREKGRTPSYFGLIIKDKPALYFAVKGPTLHNPGEAWTYSSNQPTQASSPITQRQLSRLCEVAMTRHELRLTRSLAIRTERQDSDQDS